MTPEAVTVLASQTRMHTESPWRSDAVGPGWGLRLHISYQLQVRPVLHLYGLWLTF